MKNESCRKCGTEMIPSKHPNDRCIVCKEPDRVFCPKCHIYGEIQFHPHLFDNKEELEVIKQLKVPGVA